MLCVLDVESWMGDGKAFHNVLKNLGHRHFEEGWKINSSTHICMKSSPVTGVTAGTKTAVYVEICVRVGQTEKLNRSM